MVLQNGSIARLEPETVGYALLWADGVIQLEIHPETDEQPDEQAQEQAAQTVLLRYLSMRLVGAADAAALLMEPHAADRLPRYDAVVPLRFAPLKAPERFDQCAGIVTRACAEYRKGGYRSGDDRAPRDRDEGSSSGWSCFERCVNPKLTEKGWRL